MSDNGSNDAPKVDAVGSSGETRQTSETVGEALLKVGFKPSKSGRKIVGQGKRRETLRKFSKDSHK
ncbi:hypothetical protein [Rhizobium binxianense]|jgi:hypothetical protein|uniref:hypothetical protein n=1 Tax=Rhizobium binxianense TaxID=3024242 RepID=UPI002361917F|nr:hypothetical protein [Rhizobium sp. MJ37]MDC9835698.1 hypothetical protein [Rhizobium sp. MJ37]